MSTKRIREALTMLRTQAPGGGILSALLDEAHAEVEAIEKASRDIEAWQTGERAVTREAVTAAFDLLSNIAKESK